MKSKRSRKDRARRKSRFRVKLPSTDSLFKIGFPLTKQVIIKNKEGLGVYGEGTLLSMIYRNLKRISESRHVSEEKSVVYKQLLDEFKRQHGL